MGHPSEGPGTRGASEPGFTRALTSIISRFSTPTRIFAALGAGYAFLSAAALVQVSGLLADSHPLELWGRMAYGWWVTVTLVGMLTLVGRAVARPWLGEVAPDRPSRVLAYGVAGSFAVYAALLVLAISGLLVPAGLTLVSAVILPVAALQARDLWRERGPDPDPPGESAGRVAPTDAAAPDRPPRWLVWVLGTLLALWLVPFLVQTLLPNTDWDAATYHLPMARRFITGQIAELDPAFPHWSHAGAAHLFYAVYYLLGAESGITPLNLVAALATFAGAGLTARHFWGWRAGAWAAAVVVGTTIVWELGLDARVDGILAFFVLAGSYAFLLWWSDRRLRGALLWGGMAFGLAVGVKFSALAYLLVPAAGVGLALARDPARRGSTELRAVALAAALVVVPSGYWYVRNAVILGDPVYPVLSGLKYQDDDGHLRAFDPKLEEMVAELPPDEELARDPLLARFFDAVRTPGDAEPRHMLNVIDLLLRPERYHRSKVGHTAGFFLLALLFLPFLDRRGRAWWVLALGVVPYLAVGSRFYLLRYALPSLPLMAVGAGAVLGRVRRPLLVVGLAGLLVTVDVVGYEPWRARRSPPASPDRGLMAEWTRWKAQQPLGYLSGAEGRFEWLGRVGYHGITSVIPVVMFIDGGVLQGRIAANDTVLMVAEGKGNLLLTDYLPDARDWGYRWLAELARQDGDLEAVHRSLRRRGIRFVLANYSNLLGQVGYRTEHHDEIKLVMVTVQRFFERYGQAEFYRGGVRLQDLEGPGGR